MPPVLDEYTLLCESCGYVVEGLARDGDCPECGRPIATSVPEARTGSAWQKRPGWGSWFRTNARTLLGPFSSFRRIEIERQQSQRLLQRNLWTAAILLGCANAALLFIINERPVAWPLVAVGGSLASPFWMATLIALTWVERAGIRFFGRRRGWRIDREASAAICGHASVGWVLSGLLATIAVAACSAFAAPAWTFYTPYSTYTSADPTWLVLPAAGFFAGLLAFESLVFIGVRRCRFANRALAGHDTVQPPRADPSPPPTT